MKYDTSLYESVDQPEYDPSLFEPVEKKQLYDADLYESVENAPAAVNFTPSRIAGTVGETALHVGSGMVSGILGSIRGLSPSQPEEALKSVFPKRRLYNEDVTDPTAISGPSENIITPEEIKAKQQESFDLTYQPKTAGGKVLSKYVDIPFQLLGEGIHWIANQGARGINAISPMGQEAQQSLTDKLEAGINLGLVMAPIIKSAANPISFKEPHRIIETLVDEALSEKSVGHNKFTGDLFGQDTRAQQAIHDLRLKKTATPDYVEPGAGPGTLFQPDAAKQIDIADVTKSDPRLKRDVYRSALEVTVQRDMVEGGGISLIPDESYKYGESDKPGEQQLRRTSSVNPQWVQDLLADTGLSVAEVRNAAEKALQGGRLGSRQAQAVHTILDQIGSERASPGNIAYVRGMERSVGAAQNLGNRTLGEYIDDTASKIAENISTAASLPKKAAMELAGKSITDFRKLGEVSPSFKEIADLFERPEIVKTGDPATSLPYHEAVDLGVGKYMLRLQDSLRDVGGKVTGRISKETNDALWKKIINNDYTGTLGKSAKEIRSLLNEFNEYQIKGGVDAGFIPKYFPRIYNTKILKTEKGADYFLKEMTAAGYDPTAATTWLRKIINENGILAEKGVVRADLNDPSSFQRASTEPQIRRQRNTEFSRKLTDISDEELAPVLDRNVYGVLSNYLQNGVRRTEFSRYFGPEGEKVNQLISKGITELDQSGRPLKYEELNKLYNMLDAEQGLYNPTNPLIRKVTNGLLSYQYMRTMALSTLTSIPEPLLLLERGRADATIRGVASSLNHVVKETVRIAFKGLDKAQVTREAEVLNLALDVSTVDLLSNLGGVRSSAVSAFFKANFLSAWTRYERVLSSQVGKFHILFNIRDLANGPKGIESLFAKKQMISRMEKELKEIGINPVAAVEWYKKGQDIKDPFWEKVKAGMLDYTHGIIMKARVSNLPLSASSQFPLAQFFWQLKKTQVMIGNTVMKRWYQKLFQSGVYEGVRNSGKIAVTGMMVVFAHMLLNSIRETIKYGQAGNPKFKNEDPIDEIRRALDRAGFTGAAQFAMDATLAHRFNRSGLAQLGGPLASQIDEFLDDPKRGVSNAIPGINIFPEARKMVKEAVFGTSDRGRLNR